MYPSETAWFIKEYEEAVRRPYGYLFVDLRPTTTDRCRLRTNVLPGEERFDKGFDENRISQELLKYLKQQTLIVPPPISQMQRIQNMDNLMYRTNLGEDQKTRQYMQLQNKFLNYKQQFKSLIPEATKTHPTPRVKPNFYECTDRRSTNSAKPRSRTTRNHTSDSSSSTNPSDSPTSLIYHGILFLYLISLPPSFNFDTPSHGRIAVTS